MLFFGVRCLKREPWSGLLAQQQRLLEA